ncbi:MAG: histidine phosphatase family protein [Ignavibacteriaceae bacterium]|nr:histidine phosphatase family protein [Ignavibacteriaceae bacterium]MCW8813506.1 histidine phosphatase family protein [Chlorobium sp.]MCW8818502.1 histidine phosphatase family protein [Ignavibacteriaceae bacterium]MCW8823972.1 histidine phosphatase family protein [Ignavibacteriaceae bacterium]MCW8960407.1 histidine phosphatase family protein [Ignavibacteriaceae bacterium]
MKNIKLKLLLNILMIIIILSISGYGQNSDDREIGTRTIYLIRHGEYTPQDDNIPDSENVLTPLGIAQARLVSARLQSMNIKFSSLTSSTMTRAKQTAMIINEDFPELDLKLSDLIKECTPPTWREDVMAGVDTSHRKECVENLEKAFKAFFIPSHDENDRNDIIVCHGNVIRYFVTKVLKVDTMAWLQMSITNCSLTIVRIMPDRTMRLDAFSDYGHIPENMRTYTGRNNEPKELIIH